MKKELIVRDRDNFLKELSALNLLEVMNIREDNNYTSTDLTGYTFHLKKCSNFNKFLGMDILFIVIKDSKREDYILEEFNYKLLKYLSIAEINELFNILSIHLVEINQINVGKR